VVLAIVCCRGAEDSDGKQAQAAKEQEEYRRELAAHERELADDEKVFVATLAEFASLRERATAITLYEVVNEFDQGYSAVKDKPHVAGYPIARKLNLTIESSAPLVSELTDRATYFPPGTAWSCIFEPHHVLEVAAGDKRAVAVICLKCGDIEYIMDGKSIGTHSMPSGKDLFRILSGFFPSTAA
jgi:hypothetical protein